ncbi:MAG: bifunctional transcriptional activator/DNA repair enzyme protein Ada, partial [Burkholderiales bacterium]|nr:bifunctional transcriptional activator/DNA repair enzyme protein Ada [Burkholderiales bacterium]
MNAMTDAAVKAVSDVKAPYASDEAKWEAVMQRDPAADGVFYYSVRTTGVYCR